MKEDIKLYLVISNTECVIIQYVGEDEVVEIPYKINDLEVTINKIVIPCNVEFIVPYTFVNCSNLEEVNFINSFFEYKRMHHHTFVNCNMLQSIIYSNNLKFDEYAIASDIERK